MGDVSFWNRAESGDSGTIEIFELSPVDGSFVVRDDVAEVGPPSHRRRRAAIATLIGCAVVALVVVGANVLQSDPPSYSLERAIVGLAESTTMTWQVERTGDVSAEPEAHVSLDAAANRVEYELTGERSAGGGYQALVDIDSGSWFVTGEFLGDVFDVADDQWVRIGLERTPIHNLDELLWSLRGDPRRLRELVSSDDATTLPDEVVEGVKVRRYRATVSRDDVISVLGPTYEQPLRRAAQVVSATIDMWVTGDDELVQFEVRYDVVQLHVVVAFHFDGRLEADDVDPPVITPPAPGDYVEYDEVIGVAG